MKRRKREEKQKLHDMIILEPQTTRNNWMLIYGNQGPLHSKWFFVETSINFWLFGVPGCMIREAGVQSNAMS